MLEKHGSSRLRSSAMPPTQAPGQMPKPQAISMANATS
jgi:hypothetical protein